MYRRRAGRSLVNIPDSVGGKQLTHVYFIQTYAHTYTAVILLALALKHLSLPPCYSTDHSYIDEFHCSLSSTAHHFSPSRNISRPVYSSYYLFRTQIGLLTSVTRHGITQPPATGHK